MAKLSEDDPRPFTIYRNRRGWPRWYQPLVEAWWVLTRRHSLHTAWQAGLDHGSAMEYRRLITNKAYLGEIGYRAPDHRKVLAQRLYESIHNPHRAENMSEKFVQLLRDAAAELVTQHSDQAGKPT